VAVAVAVAVYVSLIWHGAQSPRDSLRATTAATSATASTAV
jgi:hypothetical protein